MLRNRLLHHVVYCFWVGMLRNPVRNAPRGNHKMLFLAVFGWESAGMAGFLSKKIMDLKPEYWVGMLRIMQAGIDIMSSELKTYEGVTHFLTKRFDRIGNEKLHVQTLAAMNPLASSYEDLFSVIRQLNLPYEDIEQQYLRMIFNVLSKNVDDHSKNFAFTMDKKGVWRLSPAYDITFSVDLAAPNYANSHSLTINGKDDSITIDDLIEVAKKNDIKNYKALIEQVQSAISKFEEFATNNGIDEKLIVKIRKCFV